MNRLEGPTFGWELAELTRKFLALGCDPYKMCAVLADEVECVRGGLRKPLKETNVLSRES
jgi:hypothetical protein